MSDSTEPPTTSTPDPVPNTIHPRREPFEHGLLPIPKLIFADPTQTLTQLKTKLTTRARVDSASLSESLQISSETARLVLDTLASILHRDSDPVVKAKGDEIDSVGVDLRDLILFLYIQSYKKLLPRSHKDSAAVADVWPSTSAFDGYLSALSPLQVLTMEGFEHLGFLIQFGDKGFDGVPLCQATPFFANSDPDMPAVPIPATQVLDWISQNIASALERITERISAKENGPHNASDPDVSMADAYAIKAAPTARGSSFIEGVSKTSYVKRASDLKGSSVKVLNCHDSVIYILAPLRYATIYGCSDATIVLGAVGKAVRIEHCERVHVITAAKRVCIANCRECIFFLGVNQRPLIVGDNHKLQVAPYNTFYSDLEEHMAEVGIDANISRWNEPLALGVVDPHDSLSHPAGVSDAQAESASHVDPDQFTHFLIPHWFGGESSGSTKDNPFPLPDTYMTSHQRNLKNLGEIKQLLRESSLEDNQKRDLSNALHLLFKEWLYSSGNVRQLYCLQGD